jgi:predicted metal-dependent peptidase
VSMVDIRVTRARSELVQEHAFFGALIMRMQMIASYALADKSMATDGSNIWYHPDFLDEVSPAELLGILVHELFHCILGHHVRRGDRDHRLWNIACDYVVNLMVIAAGFKLPKWVLLDRQYEGLNAEQVYRLLEQQEEQEKQQQQQLQDGEEEEAGGSAGDDGDDDADSSDDGDEGDETSGQGGDDEAEEGDDATGVPDQNEGSGDDGGDEQEGDAAEGAGDNVDGDGDGTGDAAHGEGEPNSKGDPGRCGEILDAAPPHDKAALSEAEGEWEVAVRQAVNIAKRQGDVPGFIQEIIEHLNNPEVDWVEVLHRFIDPSTTKDHSWVNLNRRMITLGHYAPGVISDGVSHVGMVIDSSGSIDTELLAKIGAEVQGALDTGRIDKLTVILCDTRVAKHNEYSTGDLIDWEVPGRGGTAFRPAFDWLNENAPDIQCAIYFTDMECTDYGVAPVYPVLWAAYGDPRTLPHWMAQAPFGEIIEVN